MNPLRFRDAAFIGGLSAGGGGGGGVDPTSFSGLEAWWKADSFSLTDGTAIGGTGNEWLDQTTNAHDGTQSGAGKPVYHTNVFGTMPGIQFTAASSQELSIPVVALGTNPFTIIAIYKLSGANDSIIFGHTANNVQFRRYRSGANTISSYNGGTDFISSTLTSSATTVFMATYKRNGSGQGLMRENKTQIGFLSTGYGGDSSVNRIGNCPAIGGLFLNGYLAEMAIYTAFMSDTDNDSFYDNYAKGRGWGLP